MTMVIASVVVVILIVIGGEGRTFPKIIKQTNSSILIPGKLTVDKTLSEFIKCNKTLPSCEQSLQEWISCENNQTESISNNGRNCLPESCFTKWKYICSLEKSSLTQEIQFTDAATTVSSDYSQNYKSWNTKADEDEDTENPGGIETSEESGLPALVILLIVLAVHFPFVILIIIIYRYRNGQFRQLMYRNPLIIRLCFLRTP